ncbi:MAG: DnaD domain protein [Bacilli bacterium]|nr:DnaD domain protein [Bacilli bacterium]
MVKNLFPADTYIVKNATILKKEDQDILMKLYEPVIGSTAVSLYFTLWSNLDTMGIISTELTHHNLMATKRLKLEDILEAREKLEGIGLLKTYVKEGSVNNYIYELYSPLEPKEFIENPILSTTLQSNIGKRAYKYLLKYYIIPKIDLSSYKEITSKFTDVFDAVSSYELSEIDDIRRVKNLDLAVDEKIELNSILSSIPSEILNHRTITNEVKSLIYKLSFIYNLDEEELSELIRNSVDEKRIIDKNKLRENCHNYYTFENKNSSPSVVYKKNPEYLRKAVTGNSKKEKMIYTFENESPYDFLSGKNRGVKPSKNDLKIIESLMIDYEFPQGVVNVLIDYVLRINDNKLTKNFVLAIANQWKRNNIKTAIEAMELCKKENTTKKINTKKTKTTKKPEWYDKSIEIDEATSEDIQKLDDMLNNL